MDPESRTSILPFLLGVTIIAISATGYIVLLKSPPSSTNKAQVLADTISISTTPLPTDAITKQLPASDYPHSNFISATISSLSKPVPSLQDCELFDPTNATSPVGTSTFKGETATSQQSTIVEGSMITDIIEYHVFKDGICNQNILTLKTTNILSLDPKLGIAAVNHDEIWSRLQQL